MKTIEQAVRYMIELENMLTEQDHWLSMYSLYVLKRDMFRRYGVQTGDDEIQEHIDTLDQQVTLAGKMLEGVQHDIKAKTGLVVEEARRHLIQLKTFLNAYADKTGEEFAILRDFANQSTEILMTGIEEFISHE